MAKSNAARAAKSDPRPDAKADGKPATRGARSAPAEKAALTGVRGAAAAGTAHDLDQLIHERLRLGIVSALAVNESLSFSELKSLLQASDGNLSVHARKLEDAGYIACTKGFDGRVPRTDYRLTAEGRRALARYLDHMESLIRAARAG